MSVFDRTPRQGDLFRFREERDKVKELLEGEAAGFKVRGYQRRAVAGVFTALETHPSTLLVMATGVGKTVCAGYIALQWKLVAATYNLSPRVLFLAHRQELVSQAAAKLRKICPLDVVEVEMADRKVSAHSRARIVVASVASLQGPRLSRFGRDDFGLLIPDEAHHLVEKSSNWYGIAQHFSSAKVAGITATPNRSDRVRLADTFASVAFVYSMQEAIADGFLVPVHVQALTLHSYDDSKADPGILTLAEADEAKRQERVLQGLVSAVTKIADTPNRWGGKRPTLLFFPSVPTARQAAGIFNRHADRCGTGQATFVDCDERFCTADERKQRLRDFESGKIQFLCNYNVFSEGVDLPKVRMVVIARRVTSQLAYQQMVGRGTRPWPDVVEALNMAADPEARKRIIYESQKPGLLVVEPAEHAGRQSLVTAADVLAGDEPAPVLARVKAAIKAKGEQGRPTDVEAEIAAARSREAMEAEERRRKGIVILAGYTVKEVDPFGVLAPSAEDAVPLPGLPKDPPATPGQRAFLLKCKVSQRQVGRLTFRQAQRLIAEIGRRNVKGLCTYAQARLLQKCGFPPPVVEGMTFAQARFVIDKLKENSFRPPSEARRNAILSQMPEG